MGLGSGSACVIEVGHQALDVAPEVTVRSWRGRQISTAGTGTAFVMALEPAELGVAQGCYPLPAFGYAVVPGPGRITGGSGVVIEHRRHVGLFCVGGPVETSGRLRYIDGCRDTVLVAPVVKGDPCLSLLHLPPSLVQSDHHHPSERVGLVVAGRGTCVSGDGERAEMRPGMMFVLPAGVVHRFESDAPGLLLMAWHPDSDFGPTDDDHPMLNRTLRPGSADGFR